MSEEVNPEYKKVKIPLNIIHILNDGFLASIILLLPFIAAELGFDLKEVGFLGTMLNLIGMFVPLIAGYIVAKIGNYRALAYAVLLASLGFILTGSLSSLWQYSIVFAVAGIGFGIFHPIVFAALGKLTDKSNRGKELANFTALGDLGRLGLTSLMTFAIAGLGWRTVSLLYGVAGLVIVSIFLIYERKLKLSANLPKVEKFNFNFAKIFKNKSYLLVGLASFFDSFSSASLFVFLPFLLLAKGYDTTILGSLVGAFFVGNLLGKLFLGRLVDKFHGAKVLAIAETLMAIFIFCLVGSQPLILIIIFSIILGVMTKGTTPVLISLLHNTIEEEPNQADFYGFNAFTTNAAVTISPFIFGALAKNSGVNSVFYLMAAVVLLVNIPAFLFWQHSHLNQGVK